MAMTFSTDKADVPYTSALNPAQFSFSVCAKPTGGVGSYRSPVTSRATFLGYILYASGGNVWSFWIGNGSAWVELDGPAVVLNTWTHITCTYDGTTMRMYVNGTDIGTTTLSSFSPNIANPFRIGAGATEGGGNFWFPGLIDDVRVYDRALSAAEVATLYAQNGADGIVYGLISRWKMDEASPGTVAAGAGVVKDDIGGLGATPGGNPVYAESDLQWRRAS